MPLSGSFANRPPAAVPHAPPCPLCARSALAYVQVLLRDRDFAAFWQPVPRDVPDYYQVIERPMDLGTIRGGRVGSELAALTRRHLLNMAPAEHGTFAWHLHQAGPWGLAGTGAGNPAQPPTHRLRRCPAAPADKAAAGAYSAPGQFTSDLKLVVSNAKTYNESLQHPGGWGGGWVGGWVRGQRHACMCGGHGMRWGACLFCLCDGCHPAAAPVAAPSVS